LSRLETSREWLLSSADGAKGESKRWGVLAAVGLPAVIGLVLYLLYRQVLQVLDPAVLVALFVLGGALLVLVFSNATWQHFSLSEETIVPQYRSLIHVFQGRKRFPYDEIADVKSLETDTPLGKMWASKFSLRDGSWIYVRRMPDYPAKTYDALKVVESLVNSGRREEIPQSLRALLRPKGDMP